MAELEKAGLDQTGLDQAGVVKNETRRRGPDPLALVVGLLTLGMATSAFVGDVPSLAGLDARWLLAAGAAAIGLLLLVGSLRGRR